MDIKAWSSRMLHLLAAFLRRGGSFLERQGRRVASLAERAAGGGAPSEPAERPPGAPPAHWLEKIGAHEASAQWIHHTADVPGGGMPPGPFFSPRAGLKGSLRAEAPPGAQRTLVGEAGGRDDEATGGASPSADARGARRPASIPSGERAQSSASAGRRRAGADRQEAAGKAAESPSPRPPSSTRPGHARISEPDGSPRPVRLFEIDGPAGGEGPAESGPGSTASPFPDPGSGGRRTSPPGGRARSSSSSIHRSEAPSAPESEPSPSFPETAPAEPCSGPDRQEASRLDVAFARSPALSSAPAFARFASRGQRPSEPASMRSRAPASGSSSAAGGAGPERVPDRSPAKVDDPDQASRPAASRWPDLPGGAQILQEAAPDERRWAKWMQDRERRRRLNKEQRGQLWNE